MNVYAHILLQQQHQKKSLAVLVDPDKQNPELLAETVAIANSVNVDFFLVGGSLLTTDSLLQTVSFIKKESSIPVILFPGNATHITPHADAILFLSLISGRNPDLLIGQQVQAAPLLKASGMETISTGYILIDGGKPTTVSYVSNTVPIPADKPEIAAATALAGEMLGLKCIYLEAGSGAKIPVSEKIIQEVKKNISVPLIVGGGIRTPEKAIAACEAGADIIVIGNAAETDPLLIADMAVAVHSFSSSPVPRPSSLK
jgi:putative glycerol-1-phosphate prenyltransferase